jgi:hypothetical protein
MNELLTVGIFSTMFYSFFEFIKTYFLKYLLLLIGIKEFKINYGIYIQMMGGDKFTPRPKCDSPVMTKYGIVTTDDYNDLVLITFYYYYNKISEKQQRYLFDNHRSFLLEKIYKPRKNNCVALVYGIPGTGKSFLSMLLSQKLNCSILTCHVSRISYCYKNYHVEKTPIIFMIDEVDVELHSIKNTNESNVIEKERIIFTKKEWNEILDHIHLGFYPGLVLIMTSNQNLKEYKSELRKGRVDIMYELQ